MIIIIVTKTAWSKIITETKTAWKKTFLAVLKYCLDICLGGLRKSLGYMIHKPVTSKYTHLKKCDSSINA
jgi:hypothetical protein